MNNSYELFFSESEDYSETVIWFSKKKYSYKLVIFSDFFYSIISIQRNQCRPIPKTNDSYEFEWFLWEKKFSMTSEVQMIPELMTLMDQFFLVNQTHVFYNLLLYFSFVWK